MHPSLSDNLNEALIEVSSVKLKIPPHRAQNIISNLINHDIDVQLLGHIFDDLLLSIYVKRNVNSGMLVELQELFDEV